MVGSWLKVLSYADKGGHADSKMQETSGSQRRDQWDEPASWDCNSVGASVRTAPTHEISSVSSALHGSGKLSL